MRRPVSESYSHKDDKTTTPQRLDSHLLDPFQRGVSTDEAGSVDEDTSRYTGDTAEVLVANAAPGLGQWLAADEGAPGFGHALDHPLGRRVGLLAVQDVENVGRGSGVLNSEEVILPRRRKQVVAVKDEQASLGVVTEAVLVGASDDGAGGQPSTEAIVELALKLLADAGAGGKEAFILKLLRRLGVGGGRQDGRVVPRGVVAHHDGGEAEAGLVEARNNRGGLEGGRIVDIDAVVVRVEGLDEV
ncbi:hypothetical protein L249_1042 [Ophiocordyceps polyrhachis-furcata BCC 54312]|uniref:Uncharacterized protein n=1 Tax=Ophiocordyceps polyrhachis-furcata BCC 54312 TaxID=1330021 RepID=A0A367LEB3_9HYPO|nr:hypothetical protein L249_1042 [Ophiocordyceps polyrhachis-furcata BCC 54312]